MTQNLYAGEGNDRGWYRVSQENKKLKREIKRLRKALEIIKPRITQNPLLAVELINDALKEVPND